MKINVIFLYDNTSKTHKFSLLYLYAFFYMSDSGGIYYMISYTMKDQPNDSEIFEISIKYLQRLFLNVGS